MFQPVLEKRTIFTVSQLTGRIKRELEANFSFVEVIGELSGFKAHISGHWYFTLKDNDAVISCTMWRSVNSNVSFAPKDGMKVTITGRITVYPPRGNYQIEVRSIKPAGAGELQIAFEELKAKLLDEGLFDQSNKKEIPALPGKIALITSIDGAALKDMISIAKRRFPLVQLLVVPAKVQGLGAAEEIAKNLYIVNKRDDIDLIIVGRGGGSIEDLWAFNEEIVARAIYKSKIPVISAVGHEIDFTISDFVADLRAATPSAAMELALPDINKVEELIKSLIISISNKIKDVKNNYQIIINNYLNSYGFKYPSYLISRKYQDLDSLEYKIEKSATYILNEYKNRLEHNIQIIRMHDINRVLEKGFVLVRQDSTYITLSNKLNIARKFSLKFADKEIEVNNKELKCQ